MLYSAFHMLGVCPEASVTLDTRQVNSRLRKAVTPQSQQTNDAFHLTQNKDRQAQERASR